MRAHRLGLAISGDSVAVVRRDRQRSAGTSQLRRESDESWHSFIARALERVSRRSVRRARLDVVVADGRCVNGQLYGEDAASERREVARKFESDPQAYRIGDAGGLVGGGVWYENGAWRGVSLSKSLAEALVAACHQRRIELRTIRPAGAGALALDALAVDACDERDAAPAVVDLLRAARAAQRRRRALRVAVALALTGVVLAIGLPALRARSELAALRRELSEANATVYRLSERSGEGSRAEAVRAVSRDRGAALGLIEALSRVVPESAAVVNLRVDSTGGTLTVVAPRVADAISRLTSESRFSNAALAGAIVGEEQDHVALQRAVLTWRRSVP